MSLKEFCEMELQAYRKMNNSRQTAYKEWFYKNSESFKDVNKELSEKLSIENSCEIKQCYRNAWIATCGKRNLRYFEGFVASKSIPIPIQHAWLIDTDGKVVDPTLIINGDRMVKQLRKMGIKDHTPRGNRLGDDYFGMEIPIDFVNKMTFKKKITGEWLLDYFKSVELAQVGEIKQ